ncbi:hypothetical protein ACWIDJ_01280 [Brevundimonas naejangsanensis]
MAETNKKAGGASAAVQGRAAEEQAERRAEAAQVETDKAAAEGRLPETMAVTSPAPATEMDSASGAFIEPEIKAAIPVEHPAVENNPRAGTSAVQNGGDFNDPTRRHPSDPEFSGQGLDLSVYGKTEAKG